MPLEYKPYTDNPMLDGRRKVTPEQKQLIKEQRQQGWSFRKMARFHELDKGTIKAIIDPLWYKEKQQKQYAKKPWLDYYNKEQHTKDMRKTRAKKNRLNYTNKKYPNPIPNTHFTMRQATDQYKLNHLPLQKAVKQNKIKLEMFPKSHPYPLIEKQSLASFLQSHRTKHPLANPNAK